MIFNRDNYMAKQINGPVVNSWLQAIWQVFNKDEDYLTYLANRQLAVGKLTTYDLNWLGKMLHCPRPYYVEGSDLDLLYANADQSYVTQWLTQHGIQYVGTLNSGGQFYNPDRTVTITAATDPIYIQFILNWTSLLKSKSLDALLTLIMGWLNTDNVSAEFSEDYYYDIILHIPTDLVGYVVYLEELFAGTFTTSPRIYVDASL